MTDQGAEGKTGGAVGEVDHKSITINYLEETQCPNNSSHFHANSYLDEFQSLPDGVQSYVLRTHRVHCSNCGDWMEPQVLFDANETDYFGVTRDELLGLQSSCDEGDST